MPGNSNKVVLAGAIVLVTTAATILMLPTIIGTKPAVDREQMKKSPIQRGSMWKNLDEQAKDQKKSDS